MKLEEAKAGMPVRYVPGHAHGDRQHPDCEDGVVSSVGAYVFVRFPRNHANSEACNPTDLVPR